MPPKIAKFAQYRTSLYEVRLEFGRRKNRKRQSCWWLADSESFKVKWTVIDVVISCRLGIRRNRAASSTPFGASALSSPAGPARCSTLAGVHGATALGHRGHLGPSGTRPTATWLKFKTTAVFKTNHLFLFFLTNQQLPPVFFESASALHIY